MGKRRTMVRAIAAILGLLAPVLVAPAVTTHFATSAPTVQQPAHVYDATPVQGVPDNVLPESEALRCPVPSLDRVAGLIAAKSGVATAPSEAAFWSGRAGANRAAAEASGLRTLESTPAGRALEAQDLFSKMPYDEAIVAWDNLARQFASEASGTVNAWSGGASPMSVWSRIEKPTLLSNPNVRKIIIHDATRPEVTRIIYK